MKALVIDDSRAMRRILSDMLRDMGFDVAEAANGRSGFEVLATGPAPNVVLVDWNMPEMNGMDFVRTVRADSRFSDVPLMMVTTETELEKVVEALQQGANEYVMKPFSSDVVADKLHLLGVL
jgi:two-component system chemotaxis response regulator CheY